MTNPTRTTRSIAAATLALTCSLAAAQDDPAAKLAQERMEKMTDPTAMNTWLETTKPTLGHEVLDKFTGNWNCEMRIFWDPAAEPMVSEGHTTSEMALGGRFAHSTFKGTMMGMPYEGMGVMGYDNNRKLFNMLWVSNLETGMHVARGALNEDGSVLTMIGTMDEPMTGEMGKTYRLQYHFLSDNEMKFEIAEILYGDPFKVMEIHYERCEGDDCGHEHEG